MCLAYSEMRDLDKNPYSKDEQRVIEYLNKISPGIGAGDDPIGFLIAVYDLLRNDLLKRNKTDSGQDGNAAVC